ARSGRRGARHADASPRQGSAHMTLAGISVRNIWRNKLRAVLTVLGISIAVLAFVLLRTVLTAWTVGADFAAKDRIGTRNKVTFIVPLPKRYIEQIRQVP